MMRFSTREVKCVLAYSRGRRNALEGPETMFGSPTTSPSVSEKRL